MFDIIIYNTSIITQCIVRTANICTAYHYILKPKLTILVYFQFNNVHKQQNKTLLAFNISIQALQFK